MSIFAIGDVQGCYDRFIQLLDELRFNEREDTLWLTGDIVNRGPQSLEMLQFCFEYSGSIVMVLGNHDLQLLSILYEKSKPQPKDTIQMILNAPERDEWCDWLRHRPLLHYDRELNHAMAHAGIHPSWDLKTAMQLSRELESVLQSDAIADFLAHMYGNEPVRWENNLTGFDRLRFICNAFTRMRFLDKNTLALNLTYKGNPDTAPENLKPWFRCFEKAPDYTLLFGHWAALMGKTQSSQIIGLDTGCVWGRELTSYDLEAKKFQSV